MSSLSRYLGVFVSKGERFQAAAMRELFPQFKMGRVDGVLEWIGDLSPTRLSRVYKVRIRFSAPRWFKVNILEPSLEVREGWDRPPHTFKDWSLCLHYPEDMDWRRNMLIAQVVVPWTAEWLYNYEVWLETGEWCGDGVDHPVPNNQEEDNAAAP